MSKKEIKFWAVIISNKDADEFFTKNPECKEMFNKLNLKYFEYRIGKGKEPVNKYIIINQDEPYAEKVWKIVLEGEDEKTRNK